MNNIIRTFTAAVVMIISSAATAGPVNVNTADAKTIAKELQGIGATKAEMIVAYREQNGPFKSADDLRKIKGIGKRTIDKNRQDILVDTE